MKIGVVVPAYNKELFSKFFTSWCWYSEAYDITLYLVEDNPKKTIKIPSGIKRKHYCWKDIDKDLGEDSWIISRRSSAIRSYGYYKAYQDGMDYILTLDDDCLPTERCYSIEKLVSTHLIPIEWGGSYSNTYHVGKFLFKGDLWMRGSPIRYRNGREALVSVGGWCNNPDLDAWTQLETQGYKVDEEDVNVDYELVPRYLGLTMCGMNVMFHRSVIPIAYFLLQGDRWSVDRVDDIWCGLFMKKVMDKFDMPMAINGYATVKHERASDAMTSLKKEGMTLQENELLWDRLMTLNLEGADIKEAYKDMISKCEPEWFGTHKVKNGIDISLKYNETYGEKLLEAMKKWVSLFDDE